MSTGEEDGVEVGNDSRACLVLGVRHDAKDHKGNDKVPELKHDNFSNSRLPSGRCAKAS